MSTTLQILILFNIVSFISYGTSCFLSLKMKREFERYRLPRLRLVTGSLQIVTSLMMALGFYNPQLIRLAAFIFVVMMISALFVRIRIKDPLIAMLPALFYLLLNGVVLLQFP